VQILDKLFPQGENANLLELNEQVRKCFSTLNESVLNRKKLRVGCRKRKHLHPNNDKNANDNDKCKLISAQIQRQSTIENEPTTLMFIAVKTSVFGWFSPKYRFCI